MRNIVLFVIINCSINFIKAQSPAAINFQGVALDSNSRVITKKNIFIKCTFIEIKNSSESYSEIHKSTTDQFGQFTIFLGLGKPLLNRFGELDWSNKQYDLKVEMSNDSINFKLIGRQQILSVPYALTAANGLPRGNATGATAYWDGNKWNVDSTLYNDGKRVKIGTGTSKDTSSALEIKSTSGGFLLPRLTEQQRDSIKNPTEGLMIFCTNYYGAGKGGVVQLFNRGKWLNMFMPSSDFDDCAYLYDANIEGVSMIDSTVIIQYKYDTTEFTVPELPLIQWYRRLRDTTIKTSIVYNYYPISGENKATYKITKEDVLGIRVSLIPRNKVGAGCLIGDTVFANKSIINLRKANSITEFKSILNSYNQDIVSSAERKKITTEALTGSFMTQGPDFKFQTSSGATWNYYNKINEINFLINDIESKNIPDSLKSLLGELNAYKGYFYFELFKAFSINNNLGIPILEKYDDLESGNLVRRPADQVLALIVSTLEKAELLLPNFSDSRYLSDLSAGILKTKVLLYKKDYPNILSTFQKLNAKYNFNNNSLVSAANYISKLNDTLDFSKFNEIVFQIGGGITTFEYGRITNSANQTSTSLTGYVINDSIINNFSSTDIRKSLVNTSVGNGRKYYNKYLPLPAVNSYNQEIKMSDFYLIYAEAQARTGNASEAANWLNKVAIARDPGFTGYAANSTTILQDLIREKKKENLLEGDFYFDYIRFTNGNPNYYYSPSYTITRQQLPFRFYTGLPIPSSVIQDNPGMVQNPGW